MIIVNKVSKRYSIPHEKKHTFFESLISLIRDKYDYEEFYALKDISFKIKKGEFIGMSKIRRKHIVSLAPYQIDFSNSLSRAWNELFYE